MFKDKLQLQAERTAGNVAALHQYRIKSDRPEKKIVRRKTPLRKIAVLPCIFHPEYSGLTYPGLDCKTCCGIFIRSVK